MRSSTIPPRRTLSARFLAFVTIATTAVVTVTSTGCASRKPSATPTPATEEKLVVFGDSDLRLSRFLADGKDIALDAAPITLRFGGPGRLAGRSAVNRYSGDYTLGTNGAVTWQPTGLAMTRMAGPTSAMDLEAQYAKALTATSQLLILPEGIRFQNADASTCLDFTK